MRSSINAWIGGNRASDNTAWFQVRDEQFEPTFRVGETDWTVLEAMLRKLVDYRLAAYAARVKA